MDWDNELLQIQLSFEAESIRGEIIDIIRRNEELADWLNGDSPEYSDKWMVE
jgi:hypothetical protein